jgi:hypothetical protein
MIVGTRLILISGLFATLMSTAPTASHAQEPSRPRGVLTGRVVNAATQQPIEGALTRIDGTTFETMTNATGEFRFSDVPVGAYRVRVRAIGFREYVLADVLVGSGKPYTRTVMLEPQPVLLEAIEVRPSFFRRSEQSTGSSQNLGTEEVRRAPGVQEDVVRAIALLPGVAVTAAGRNDLIVRGGAPYENLFLVDGIEVANINHFGSQGSTGGPLSLINIDLVREAEFSAGGFGAKYGDRTASLTSIMLREGSRDRLSGELNLSATGFGAIAEGPLGPNTSFLLSARRSYLDLLFKAAGFSFVPAYWDFQLKTTTRLNTSNTISFLAIGAINTVTFFDEDADDRYDNSQILSPEQNQYFAGLTWKRFLSNGLLTVTLGRTFNRFRSVQRDSLVPPTEIFRGFSDEGTNTLRSDLVLELSPRLELTVGNVAGVASALDYELALDGDLRRDQTGAPQPLGVDTSFTALRNASYVEARYYLTPALEVRIGTRADYYGFLTESFRIAPRVGISFDLTGQTALTVSAGRYYQAPSYIWLVGDPMNATRLEPLRADQVVAGVQLQLREDTKLQIEGYLKRYHDYPARTFRPQAVLAPSGFENVTNDIPFGLEPLESEGTGRAYGLEVFLQKRPSDVPFYGLASLAVARSTFTGIDGVSRPGAYDGRIIGNLLVGYRPNAAWELSGKFRVASGLPTTPFVSSGPDIGRLDFDRYNAGPRLPTVHALDLRVDRRWSFRRWQLDVYLDVQNVYSRANVSRYQWNARDQAPEANESLGVLPSVGVNIEF